MPYPAITPGQAKNWWTRWNATESPDQIPPVPEPEIRGGDTDAVDWDDLCSNIARRLIEIYHENGGNTAKFEGHGSAFIHQSMPMHPALEDMEFWVWFAVAHGVKLIQLRHPPSKSEREGGRRIPLSAHFTLADRGRDIPFFRMWWRGEVSFQPDSESPYDLTAIGGHNDWRIMIFGRSPLRAQTLLHALLRLIREENAGAAQLERMGIEINKAAENVVVESLTDEQADDFVRRQWRKVISAQTA